MTGREMFRVDDVDYPVRACPFCGGTSLRLVTHEPDGVRVFRRKYSVLCDYSLGGCGAEGGIYPGIVEAIGMWNMRRKRWHP